ncbi:TerD domain-containing protein [Paenibacillus albidus]|uniref:TerD family protein n=1 Tax=Paenibacillus albidus TaxID=2041023 RepID=UPI001BE88C29|nr:TerD family protein [Paenibacillus albidus]MBT2288351.1 TerD domain-containing protein [Paenibacillus albidus]
MTISLIKGQKADLTKANPLLSTLIVGMGWQNNHAAVEVDFSVFLLTAEQKVTRDEDLIFYGNPSGPNGSISVLDNASDTFAGASDLTRLSVVLSSIPPQYERAAFALTIYEGERRRQNFSLLENVYIRIIDSATGSELIRYPITQDFSVETAIVAGEIYKYKGEWKFSAIGSGYAGGLAALCASYGIEVQSNEGSSPPATPSPEPRQEPSTPPQPNSIPFDFSKIVLKKRGDAINLQKGTGPLGEILVNLNWNQRKSSGWFGSKGVDLDLGCLFELKNGMKGAIQALGESFGSLNRSPFISLDGDDRTGAVSTGENLRINGHYLHEIERIVIFAFIYEGITNWSEADGIVSIKQQGGPEIEVRLDEHNNSKGMCAIAMIRNVNDQTFSVERLVEYFAGHRELDQRYHWNLKWEAGSK